jgi:hypothetical protein
MNKITYQTNRLALKNERCVLAINSRIVGEPYIGIVSGVRLTGQKTWRDLLLLAQSCNTCLSSLPNLLEGQTTQTAVVSHPFHEEFHEEFLVHGGLVA